MNPYSGLSFFSFIILFFKRISLFLTARMSASELASDEIQVLTLMIIGISAALIGSFLFLKKMTMLANSLSHTSLLGIVLSFLFFKFFNPSMLFSFNTTFFLAAAFLTALITIGFIDFLRKKCHLHEEASVGFVFTFLFALGVLLVTVFTKNAHIGVEAIMGNIDAVSIYDLKISFGVCLINLLFFIFGFSYFKIFAFDEILADLQKCHPKIIYYVLMMLTSLSAIAAFRAVGVFLFLVFLTAPVLTARLLTYQLKTLIIISLMINVGCALFGVALSRSLLTNYDLSLSTGAITAVKVSLSYPLCAIYVFLKSKTRLLFLKHQRT